MPGERVLLIVNVHARQGDAQHEAARALLEARGFAVLDRSAAEARDIPDLIRRHAGAVDLIVLGGGDGTLNRAVEAVLESGLPLGILPMGTANDLARTLGLPAALDAACDVIAGACQRRIDLGRVNGKYFFNVASMGMSVEIARSLTKDMKRRWGVLGYCVAALERYRAARPFRAEIEADGRHVSVRSVQLAVGNGRFYGGGMTVAEDAAIDDGLLDLYSLEPGSFVRLLAMLPAFRAGRHRGVKEIHDLRARHIAVRTSRPLPINTDGELTTETPARFEVAPRILSVFVPGAVQTPGLKEARNDAA